MSKNSLSKNQELRKGDYLMSNNGDYKAIFQDDGNFVIYTWKPIWASNTDGSDATRLCMQRDGNLVMYNKDGKPRWHTNTARTNVNLCNTRLNNDGHLVVNNENEECWNSATSKGMK